MSTHFESLIQQGVQASRADDADAALDLFRQAAQSEPGSPLPHFLAAGELAQAGRMSEAESAYAAAVLLGPDLTVARYQLGLLQFATDRLALALTTWQPLLGLPETDCMRHFVQGFFAMAAEDAPQAETHFRAGLALNTANPPMNADIERILASLAALRPESGPAGSVFAESAPTSPTTTAQGADTDGTVDEDATAHVLLANYQPAGKPN